MRIESSKEYKKLFQKLPKDSKSRALQALIIFSKNPFDPSLRNHPLQGRYKGLRSIDAAYDLRIIFEEKDGTYELVTLITLGSYSHLYGK